MRRPVEPGAAPQSRCFPANLDLMKHTLLTTLLLVGLVSTGLAQQTRVLRIEGDAFMLGELGFILNEADGLLRVVTQMPDPKHTITPDGPMLQAGDEVRFFNGERLRTVDALTAWYKALDPGTRLELGIRRGDRTLVTRFPKSSEAISGLVSEVMQNRDGDDGGKRVRRYAGSPDSAPDLAPVADLGVVARVEGTTLTVDMAYAPNHPAKLQEGDVLVKLNGTALTSAKGLEDALAKLKVGDEVTLDYKRGGKTHTATFPKPEATEGPRIMIRTN